MKKKQKKVLLWGAIGLGAWWLLSRPKSANNNPASSGNNIVRSSNVMPYTSAPAVGRPYRDAIV